MGWLLVVSAPDPLSVGDVVARLNNPGPVRKSPSHEPLVRVRRLDGPPNNPDNTQLRLDRFTEAVQEYPTFRVRLIANAERVSCAQVPLRSG